MAVGVSLGPFIVLALAIVPFRASLSISTTALILMVPVVGVSTDGFYIGAFDVAVGFLKYNHVLILSTTHFPWEKAKTGLPW
ncbi:hypothetical protein SAMN02745225_00408 [Ferrithrix thermotolerans DSM 19514]|uniref:Uncharacterized protein n=1 Tax=Ferrithrix thermotolerans DSM 19514 TaxID=1121881 RepID=A0A1M4SVU2_9ACTN|nr:hypothetical protein [Ferrithrix thermotolerans]SHE36289.1 hypothetical protein SAMN02745225_00408 [Ferrithrix thermotolerans DSM 19514]